MAPRSIAVIGASRHPGSIGYELFRNLLAFGFEGPVYPVNPSSTSVAGVRAYPTLLDVPDEVDLAVIVVPAARVPDVVARVRGEARARHGDHLGRLRGGRCRRARRPSATWSRPRAATACA